MNTIVNVNKPDQGKCLPDLLWEQVRTRPDQAAVICGQQRLSFRELAQNSSILAAYLRHLGVVGDACIGIFVEPSLELMTGVWGILLAGGAYLPLSPEYPEERLRYMVEDARVDVVFAQEELKGRLARLAPAGTRIVTMEDALAHHVARGRTVAHAAQQQHEPVRPHNLAYIIYTSGSTGKPKGVMIEHHSIVSQMGWLQDAYQLDHQRVVLQKTPMSFDAAQWEILAPACGSTVVVGAPGIYRDPEALVDTIVEHQVTTLQCVPTLLQALLDSDRFQDCRSLTQIFSGGEILSRHLAQQCLDTMANCQLINLYGPTECTINSSSYRVLRDTVAAGPNAISIGAPVRDTQYYILDSKMELVKPGEIGELYIGGVQLARGYLHRPDLTAERFVDNPLAPEGRGDRLYRTGDLGVWNPDGTVQFSGRADNQVKLRGFRVELDEIRLAIEDHDWVKNAALLIRNDSRTGFQNLIACIELNPREAALMDQGKHGAHHQSKKSKLQVKAQLSNVGCRDAADLAPRVTVELPGKQASAAQRQRVFARKTYRYFEGGPVNRDDLVQLLAGPQASAAARSLASLDFTEFGRIVRNFGQFASDERLLPKYGYASPGALYATQMYFELGGIGGLRHGLYYYHPVHHQLALISELPGESGGRIKLHFIGKKSAIEPVYKNNIQEVLEMETGHMLGLFDRILPAHQLAIDGGAFQPEVKAQLACADEDYYLGSFELVSAAQQGERPQQAMDIYVQAHGDKVAGLPGGQYRYHDGGFEAVSDQLIEKKHVIAINQQVYERASFGVSLISRDARDWMQFIALGRKLQHLQMNGCQLGFMASGYSSKTGNDLPSAKRVAAILAQRGGIQGQFYFALGGRISEEQIASEGMKEDAIHMQGPAEIIKEDLLNLLPNYMMPNKIIVLDRLPLTANGKIDHQALAASEQANAEASDKPFVAPRTPTELRIGEIWRKAMKWDAVSVHDDFFESGGNSLIAVRLINHINKAFGSSLPLQLLFEATTIEKLAAKVDEGQGAALSRLVLLAKGGDRKAIYCWPGLGGYPMNLRLLAQQVDSDHPFYGVQAHGINRDEVAYASIARMAAEDILAIKRVQPHGPYTLWGYSFGARVAFEVAYQLEQGGEVVDDLYLIAPGSPKLRAQDAAVHGNAPSYDNPAFVTILYSVFTHSISGPGLAECLKVAKDKHSFAAFICARIRSLDQDLVERIIDIVCQTYEFKYTFHELAERTLRAPLTIFKADGDDYSFIENSAGFSEVEPDVIKLEADHYSMLKLPGIDELVSVIHARLGVAPGRKVAEDASELAAG